MTRQATVLVVHGMPVDSAVDMDVGDDMAVLMAVMVVRFFRGGRGCCCRNERPFEAERTAVIMRMTANLETNGGKQRRKTIQLQAGTFQTTLAQW